MFRIITWPFTDCLQSEVRCSLDPEWEVGTNFFVFEGSDICAVLLRTDCGEGAVVADDLKKYTGDEPGTFIILLKSDGRGYILGRPSIRFFRRCG